MFPVIIHIGRWQVHAHFVMEVLAYAMGFRLFLRLRRQSGDFLGRLDRLAIVTAAIAGAAAGSLLLAHWANEASTWLAGKTIVGGLVGGLIGVELTKKLMGIRHSTGDLFALPLAVGTFIGRLGCFFEGLADHTYGIATSLPWGVDLGDGVRRHPTQLYDIVWVGMLAGWILWFQKQPHRPGDVFKGYMVGYLGWRLVIDFWKPGNPIMGLTAIQWVCAAALLYYAKDIPYLVRFRQEPAYA